MDTFSLLKYWRANVRSSSSAAAANPASSSSSNVLTATIATSVLRPSTESDEEEDEGSFFDLEFAVQNAPGDEADSALEESGDEAEGGQGELNFTVSSSSTSSSSSSSSSASSDPSISLSPSDDLFFKGQLLPLEPASILITTASDSGHKISQFPVSLLKSATKLRVFMLGLKKPKSIQADPNAATTTTTTTPKQHQNQSQNNKFFIKFKVEGVPIVSLFTRESSGGKKSTVKSEEEAVVTAEEKKSSKETVQKYINKIKPMYVRVSKRYGDKLRFSGQLTAEVAAPADFTGGDEAAREPAPAKVKMPAGLRVVRKRLGKSKSASLAVVAPVPSPPGAQQRRDDSLLQQQDGIQSAIAHCKRSLNATTRQGDDNGTELDPVTARSF